MLGPLLKADLKTVKSTSYLWHLRKGQKNGKEKTVQRFEDLTGDEEEKKAESWKMLVSVCRGEDWCPSSSSPAILFVYAHAACCPCYMGFQAVCDVLFYLLVSQSQDGSATDQDPNMRSPLNFRPFKCHTHLYPFKPHLSFTFQHCHCSLTNTQFFQQTTCILVVKINSQQRN